jgi:hypothetical protein
MPSEQDDLVGIKFPSGVRNIEYGVWRSRCCGDEIVLYSGAIFPICNRHKDALTEWVLIATDILDKTNIAHFGSRLRESDFRAPIQHLPSERLKELSRGVMFEETDSEHLKTCGSCRSLLHQFAHQNQRRYSGETDRPKSA